MKRERVKDIIIAIMAIAIFVLAWLLFSKDSGRYCTPVGIGKQPVIQTDTLSKDSLRTP